MRRGNHVVWTCSLAGFRDMESHQENPVFTFRAFFVLFLVAASKKRSNTIKYCLLQKRNPLYFSGYVLPVLR